MATGTRKMWWEGMQGAVPISGRVGDGDADIEVWEEYRVEGWRANIGLGLLYTRIHAAGGRSVLVRRPSRSVCVASRASTFVTFVSWFEM
jgi:hypothetical protein